MATRFPFLFGGTFIEAGAQQLRQSLGLGYFPSFSEGLSLRHEAGVVSAVVEFGFPFLFGGTFIEAGNNWGYLEPEVRRFPFLFGGTFIEAGKVRLLKVFGRAFPFLFGGTFIEAKVLIFLAAGLGLYFPSFSEGLSLRQSVRDALGGSDAFPFLFGGTFIEARLNVLFQVVPASISLPFRRDFH